MATKAGVEAVMLFVAELNGYKVGTVAGKLQFGIQCWIEGVVPQLDPSSEHDRKEVYEVIWLRRLYRDLDQAFGFGRWSKVMHRRLVKGQMSYADCIANLDPNYKWTVPGEADASASMLQCIGLLLGDARLLEMTNVTSTGELRDPWSIPGLSRAQVKKAATPMLYGSSKACHELWQDNGIKYTYEDVQLFNQELATGAYGVANAFKDFIINNCKPTEIMQLQVMDECFTVECNRYKHIGEETIGYDLYDSHSGVIKRIHHTRTRKVPDLEQFRRFFVTGLVHNLDSQVADRVANAVVDAGGFIVPIHDAFVVDPEYMGLVRYEYSKALQEIYDNRHTILGNYFTSIGIGAEAQQRWNAVMALVHPADSVTVGPWGLK